MAMLVIINQIDPNSKHTKNYGKSLSLIGKPSINGPFSMMAMAMLVIINHIVKYLESLSWTLGWMKLHLVQKLQTPAANWCPPRDVCLFLSLYVVNISKNACNYRYTHTHTSTYIYIYTYIVCVCVYIYILVGGFNPSETYESRMGWLFPIYGKS